MRNGQLEQRGYFSQTAIYRYMTLPQTLMNQFTPRLILLTSEVQDTILISGKSEIKILHLYIILYFVYDLIRNVLYFTFCIILYIRYNIFNVKF
jgi:hypothetical protein